MNKSFKPQIKVEVDQVEDGPSSRVARDFLERLITELGISNYRHFMAYRKIDLDYPLWYPERNQYSHFSAAISKLSPVHLSEFAVDRTPGGKGSHQNGEKGRADFYIHYRGTDIFLELKRAASNVGKEGPSNERVTTAWTQLKKQVRGLGKELRGWSDKPARIGLMVVFPYRVIPSSKAKRSSTEPAQFDWKWPTLPKDCHWAATLTFPETMRSHDQGNGKTSETMGVQFVAYLCLPKSAKKT